MLQVEWLIDALNSSLCLNSNFLAIIFIELKVLHWLYKLMGINTASLHNISSRIWLPKIYCSPLCTKRFTDGISYLRNVGCFQRICKGLDSIILSFLLVYFLGVVNCPRHLKLCKKKEQKWSKQWLYINHNKRIHIRECLKHIYPPHLVGTRGGPNMIPVIRLLLTINLGTSVVIEQFLTFRVMYIFLVNQSRGW